MKIVPVSFTFILFSLILLTTNGFPSEYKYKEEWLVPRDILSNIPFLSWFSDQSSDQEINENLNDTTESEEMNDSDSKIHLFKEPNEALKDKSIPVHDLVSGLQQTAKTSNNKEQQKSVVKLLKSLRKQLIENPSRYAKICFDNVWQLVDLGEYNSSTRTRGVEETTTSINMILEFLKGLIEFVQRVFINKNGLLSGFMQPKGTFIKIPATTNNQHTVQNIDSNIAYWHILEIMKKLGLDSSKNQIMAEKSSKEKIIYFYELLKKPGNVDVQQIWLIIAEIYNIMLNPKHLDDTDLTNLQNLIILLKGEPKFNEIFKTIEKEKDPEVSSITNIFKNINGPGEKGSTTIVYLTYDPKADNKIQTLEKKADLDPKSSTNVIFLEQPNDYYNIIRKLDLNASENRAIIEKSPAEEIKYFTKLMNDNDLDTRKRLIIILEIHRLLSQNLEEKERKNLYNLIILVRKDPVFNEIFEDIEKENDQKFSNVVAIIKKVEDPEKKISSKSKPELVKQEEDPKKSEHFEHPQMQISPPPFVVEKTRNDDPSMQSTILQVDPYVSSFSNDPENHSSSSASNQSKHVPSEIMNSYDPKNDIKKEGIHHEQTDTKHLEHNSSLNVESSPTDGDQNMHHENDLSHKRFISYTHSATDNDALQLYKPELKWDGNGYSYTLKTSSYHTPSNSYFSDHAYDNKLHENELKRLEYRVQNRHGLSPASREELITDLYKMFNTSLTFNEIAKLYRLMDAVRDDKFFSNSFVSRNDAPNLWDIFKMHPEFSDPVSTYTHSFYSEPHSSGLLRPPKSVENERAMEYPNLLTRGGRMDHKAT